MSSQRVQNRELQSGIFEMPGAPSIGGQLTEVEDSFIDAWASMACAFAMDPTMGRIHALVYLATDALDAPAISARLGLPREVVDLHLATLLDWKLVYAEGRGFRAEQDPWVWFANTIRARQRRELLPVRDAIENVRRSARLLAKTAKGPNAHKIGLLVARIERFASFVCDIAKLVDAFVTLGAAPMLKFVSMTTRFVPRRAA